MKSKEHCKGSHLEKMGLLVLVLLATLVVRLYLFVHTPVIASDATLYIHQAQLMAQGAWREAVAGDFEPLFPSFIFLFHTVLPDWELAGKLASLFFGVLAVIPLFLICHEIFGTRIAFWSGILFALHPYFARHSAEALTEPAFIFFFLLSLWLALKALRSPGMKLYLFCALAILITWLSRGEGIWLFPALFLFFGLRCMSDRPDGKWGGITPLLRLSLAFLTVMIPVTVYGIQSGNLSRLSSLKGLEWLVSALRQIPDFLQGGLARLGSVGVGGEVACAW